MFEFVGLIIILSILTIGGIGLFLIFYKTNNKFFTLGGGMVIGPLFFLLILSLFAYIFKGFIAIKLFFFVYIFFNWYIIKNKGLFHRIVNVFKVKKSFENFLVITVVITYLILIILLLPSNGNGADNYIYSGIASSFARGNYPTVLPWQPTFLTIYHHGIFAFEGAIDSLFDTDFALTNIIFSGYLIFAIFFMLTGLVREKNRSLICLLPAIGFCLYGGPIFIYSGFGKLMHTLFTSLSFKEAIHTLALYPQISDYRSPMGGGSIDLANLAFVNFATFGLATFILFLILLFQGFKDQKLILKYLVLTIISILLLSIDETIFLIALPTLLVKVFLDYRKQRFSEIIKLLYCLLLFIVLFFAIQNPVRDSILTPNKEYPRFLFLTPLDSIYPKHSIHNSLPSKIKRSWNQLYSRSLVLNGGSLEIAGTRWYLADWHLVIISILLFSILIKSKWTFILAISSVLSFILGLSITNTFWPTNYERFFTLTFILTMISLGFLISDLFIKRKIYYFISIIIILILLPQILTAHARILDRDNLTPYFHLQGRNGYDLNLKSIANIVPYNKNIIFFDGYPYEAQSSNLNLMAVTKFGMFVPMSPPKNKILNPDDQGIEFYDIMTNLSPTAAKKLNLDYIFIVNSAIKYLSANRQNQLSNPLYFTPILLNPYGTLYQISEDFKNMLDDQITLKDLVDKIPDGKTVYLDTFYTNYIPKDLILELAPRTNLISYPHVEGGGAFILIEKYLPFQRVCTQYDRIRNQIGICDVYPAIEKVTNKVDFILADPRTNPQLIFPGKWVQLAEVPYVILWVNQ